MKYFLMGNQSRLTGIQSVVSNATKHQDQKKMTLIIICWVLPCLIHKKVKMMEIYMKETIKRVTQDQPVILSHSNIRRCYTKGITSINRQMPVPLGISGGKALSHFALFMLRMQ
jgi:hypothetical protein